jgi:signal transduction histidine kinase/CheY-like chemotaxis protein
MKTLLVLAQHLDLVEAIRAGLNPEDYRVIHRLNLEEALPLLSHGMADACILDVEQADVQGLWIIEKLRRQAPRCPVLVYTGAARWEWEEEAYLQGVSNVLSKPVRTRTLLTLLQRLWPAPTPGAVPSLSPRPSEVSRMTSESPHPPSAALQVLRNFSGILTHSLCAEAMLRQFLLLMREILGVNRAIVFLRQPVSVFGGVPSFTESRRMRSACAIGLSPGLLEHFELSFETGIGGYLFRQGRILRRDSQEAQRDVEAQKEFEILGAQVAIPMLDRETLVGVAAFDGRVTGEPLVNGELELIFHLLEELGLAVKNIWLHDQLAANHEMLADILRQLSSACVVVSRDLTILHANRTARQYFARAARRGAELEFSDLPQLLGSKVYQVLKTGTGVAPFTYRPPESPGTVFHVTIVPFQRQSSALPNSALLVVEDRTQAEQLQRLEIEAANLRLVRTMADRLAHEIGNSLVPISIHQQLLPEKFKEPEFRSSLDAALAEGVKRITRLVSQMRYLARDAVISKEAFPLNQLIEEAFQEAQKYQPVKSADLKVEDGPQPLILAGERAALKHALCEVVINALQANPTDAKVGVRVHTETDANGSRWVHLEIQDNGPGFTLEAAQRVPEPFYTTRSVGLGLGLSVCRKIVETHHGKLAIVGPKNGESSLVRISLPLANG